MFFGLWFPLSSCQPCYSLIFIVTISSDLNSTSRIQVTRLNLLTESRVNPHLQFIELNCTCCALYYVESQTHRSKDNTWTTLLRIILNTIMYSLAPKDVLPLLSFVPHLKITLNSTHCSINSHQLDETNISSKSFFPPKSHTSLWKFLH